MEDHIEKRVLKIRFSPLLKLMPSSTKKNKYSFVDAKTGQEHKGYDGECPGVYVWGFLNNEKFIPYYVGVKVDSILNRINDHKNKIESPSSHYVRLSKSYMTGNDGKTPYWFDEDFPHTVYQGIPSKWCLKYKDEKVDFWSKKDVTKKLMDYNREDIDTLCSLNNGTYKLREDFRLFYWNIDDVYENGIKSRAIKDVWEKQISQEKKLEMLEIFECLIKYSLKGNTVGKSISIPAMKTKLENIIPDTEIAILNQKDFTDTSGYFHNQKVETLKYHKEIVGFGDKDPYQ